MKIYCLSLTLLFSLLAHADFNAEYPRGPIEDLTPGSLCDIPDSYRYAERIPYCNREVDRDLKEDVFREYRLEGYRLDPRRRSDYKIDHLIPLCAGGSNRENNLWPQHVSIYRKTDSMEQVGCEKLKAGKIKQARLVQMILAAKKDLSIVPRTLSYLRNL